MPVTTAPPSCADSAETGLGSVAVILPALNEEATIGEVVSQVARVRPNEIIVVDNSSTDRTAELADQAGAAVVSQPQRGYGAACLAGSVAAGADILVFMDADGSFFAADIASLVQPIARGRADLVLGSRTMVGSGAILPHQRFGNWLATRLLRWFYGARFTDLGPLRAIRREALLNLGMTEMTYGWPIEMMIKAHRAGLRVQEVPVRYGERLGGRSKVSGTLKGSIKAGWRIIVTVLRSASHGGPAAETGESV